MDELVLPAGCRLSNNLLGHGGHVGVKFRLKLEGACARPQAIRSCMALDGTCPILSLVFGGFHHLTHLTLGVPGLVRLNRFLGREQLLKPRSYLKN